MLLTFVLLAVSAVNSAQAHTTGFRIVFGSDTDCGGGLADQALDLALSGMASLTVTLWENNSPDDDLRYTLDGAEETNPDFATSGSEIGSRIQWDFTNASGDQEYEGFAVSFGGSTQSPSADGQYNADGGALTYAGTGEDFKLFSNPNSAYRPVLRATYTGDPSGVNRPPVFDPPNYAFTLAPGQSGATTAVPVGTVSATDPDGDALTYSLIGSGSNRFTVSDAGAISYIGPGETGDTPSYNLTAVATDTGDLQSSAKVTVTIEGDGGGSDVPKFPFESYAFNLVEETPEGTAVSLDTVAATVELDVAIAYSLEGAPEDKFSIDLITGVLSYVGNGEDFETPPNVYNFMVRARTSDEVYTDVPVVVTVVNVNEAPTFATTTFAFSIPESVAAGDTVGSAMAMDPDAGDMITYSLSGKDADRFAVSMGSITYAGAGEDFETLPNSYALTLTATDRADLKSTADITVTITDVVELPRFEQSSYAFDLMENKAGPLLLGKTTATHDEGRPFTYQLVGADARSFSIDAAGALSYTGSGENYESEMRAFMFKVRATDNRNLSTEADVTVTVVNVGEAPVFSQSQYDLMLDENDAGPVQIGELMATDPESDAISYSLEGSGALQFRIGRSNGVVSYTGPGEDYEGGPQRYEFEALAIDPGGLQGRTEVEVTIMDVNEAPTFSMTSYTFQLKENDAGPVVVGSTESSDPDGGNLTFSLTGAASTHFNIDDGDIIYTGSGENFEDGMPPFVFSAIVTDTGNLSATAEITVTVTDVNESPSFDAAEYFFTLSENLPGPTTVGRVNASDPDNDALTLSLSGASAELFGVYGAGNIRYVGSGEDFEGGPGSYVLTVNATDGDGLSASVQATVTILDENESPMAVGTFDDVFMQVDASTLSMDVEANFSDPDSDPLNYSASAATQGVADVSVSGTQLMVTPIAIGVTSVTVMAEDPDGLSASQEFTVTIQVSVAERARTLKFTLAAVARTIGTETVDVIGSRMNASRSHGQLMGQSLSCGVFSAGQSCSLQTFAGTAASLLGLRASRPQGGMHSMLTPAALAGMSTLGSARSPIGLQHQSLLSHSSFQAAKGDLTLWGRGNIGSFEGSPDDGFSMEGSTSSIYFGGDYQFGSKFLAGVAISATSGEVDFSSSLNGDGSIETSLTGIHPYVRYAPSAGLSLWGVLGGGSGSADISEDLGDDLSTDLSMTMAAAGLRQAIGSTFALKADVFTVQIDSDLAADLEEVTARAQRLRIAPELGVRRSNATSSYSGSVEMGLRVDGGDADNGVGAEAAVSGGYAHAGSGLSMDFRARTLLVHQAEGYSDWGASLTLRLTPGGDEGLAISVEPSWGNAYGGADALFRQEGTLGQVMSMAGSSEVKARPDRVGVQIGYKMPVSARTRMAPFGRWTNNAYSGYNVQAGTSIAVLGQQGGSQPMVTVDVFTEQNVSGHAGASTRVGLRGSVKLK